MIALYCRLSVADGDDGCESDSIINQRMILADFVSSREDLRGEQHRFYVDDGISGTHAENRPALQEMLADCRTGKVSTVVVKDLSRLSRDGLYCVSLVEDELPAMGVRVIAVSDNYDSKRDAGRVAAGTELGFKAIMNSWYSKDLSHKVTQSIRMEHARGMNLNTVPFGYRRGKSKYTCVIDEVSGPIVTHIFELAAGGMDQVAIARVLNDEGAVTPNNLLAQRNPGSKYIEKPKQRWTGKMVKNIVTNPHHKGTLVLAKKRRVEMGLPAQRANDDGERWVFEDAHEAIVSAKVWERAQASMTSSNACGKMEPLNHLFVGYIFCSRCGKSVSYRGDNYPSYVAYCGCWDEPVRITLEALTKVVAAVVRSHMDLVLGLSEALAAQAARPGERERVQERLHQIGLVKLSAYERYRRGEKSAGDFSILKSSLEVEEQKLRRTLARIDGRDGPSGSDRIRLERAAKLAKRFSGESVLSREAVEAFVSRITLIGDDSVEIELAYQDLFASQQA